MNDRKSESFEGLPLFHRLFYSFTAISLLIESVMGTVYFLYARERVEEFERKEIEHLLRNALHYFDNTYKVAITSDLILLEASPSLDHFLSAAQDDRTLVRFDIEKMFARLTQSHANLYRSIYFLDTFGYEKIVIRDHKRVRQYESVHNYRQKGDPLHLGMADLFDRIRRASPGSVLLEGPFRDGGGRQILVAGISKREPEIAGFGGMIMFHCDLEDFITYLSKIKVFDRPIAWLFSEGGKTLLEPPGAGRLPHPLDSMDKEKIEIAVDKDIHHHDTFIHSRSCIFGADNRPLFRIAFSFHPDIFSRMIRELLTRTIIVVMLVVLAAGILSFVLAKQIASPVVKLSHASRSFSRGEWTPELPVMEGGGEVGELSRSFHAMALSLQESIRKRDREIEQRKEVEAQLHRAHGELEKRVEERTRELQKAHEQLLHAEKLSAIGALSASIAHEFNNPIQGIMNVLKGVARRSTLSPEDARLMNMAVGECNRMRDLIKNLQDFNRPSSGRRASVDLCAALDSLLLLSRKELISREIQVEKKYGENTPVIQGVGDQLKQVFLNLLNNAADACVNGGTITIETENLGDRVAVRISDTGIGIMPEDRGRIFDPFFSTKPGVKGTGLGLSVSYGIVKGHDGSIDVTSEPGKGSTFTVVLPV